MEAHAEGGSLSLSRSKRGLLVASLVLLAGLFVVRPGADRLRWRIVRSISLAVGRPVQVGYVSLRFIPPGFQINKFAIQDDPGFSAEPMLRSDEVVARLRVTSLLRGRLEISRLELTDPSLNLVRNGEGHWNVETILERAAQTPVAPTSKAKSESRPAFPYIEADNGRINFKIGQEKKANALTEADFGIWQDSENSWGMRLKARPVRTDFNLTDTGILRANGTWQRAASLRETPLQFTLEWDQGQLGQLSKFVSGNDKGWRGTLTIDSSLSGTPAALKFDTTASIQDFRRYDLLSGSAMRVAAHCSGMYSTIDRSISALDCVAPAGDGLISVRGGIQHISQPLLYSIQLKLKNVPASSVMALVRRAKKNIPDDLAAEGRVDANLSLERTEDGAEWAGDGEVSAVKLSSSTENAQITLSSIPFSLSSPAEPEQQKHPRKVAGQASPRIEFGKFDLPMGTDRVLTAHGWVSRTGYSVSLDGDAQVQRLLQLARLVGMPALRPTADGQAKIDLQVAGEWSGFAAPITTGVAQLHSVRAEVRGVNAPLQIASGTVSLLPDQIRVQNLTAGFGSSTWKGSVELPRGCSSPETCPVQFELHTENVVSDELARLLDPHKGKRPWYRFLSPSASAQSYLAVLHASGKLTANRVEFATVVANKVSANVDLGSGQLKLTDLHGTVLGGTHSGEWSADFTTSPPEYRGNGTLEHASMEQVAAAMHDGWVTGTANANYEVVASGLNLSDLAAAASGKLRIEVKDGTLPHIELASGRGAVRIQRLAALFSLHNGSFQIEQGKLETPAGIFQLSGTASFGQALNVKLAREAGQGYIITGTLPEPKIVPTTAIETRASLKQ